MAARRSSVPTAARRRPAPRFAGSERAPFTDFSPPVPRNPYGEAKLAVEEEARALSHRWRLPTVPARITNLYGPGQHLAENQGLVSAIIKARLSGEPLPLRAALETRATTSTCGTAPGWPSRRWRRCVPVPGGRTRMSARSSPAGGPSGSTSS
ncbi:NAD-dependent epimerase/dehydratase family protein [Kitasatospora sp. NPDC001159]